MQVTVSIDVPTIDEGVKFFGAVFGFAETARPHPGYAMLAQGDATIGLLAKPAGSSPAQGSSDVRKSRPPELAARVRRRSGRRGRPRG